MVSCGAIGSASPSLAPPTPSLTNFSPQSGFAGTSVTITGANLTGATALSFNGTAAVFTVSSDTQILTSVPAGATSGTLRVTTPNGSASSSASFSVAVPTPTITSFSPSSGTVGTSVILTGTNFAGATGVAFNGASATFSITSATQITMAVPGGASTGRISVTTPGGTATSSANFTLNASTGLDLTIDGLYVTQATQDYPTAISLLTSRSAWIRVFVKANQANTVTPQVRVQFINGTTTNALTINAPGASVPTTIDPSVDASWDAAVPAGWILAGTQVVATVNPSGAIPETDLTNNSFTQNLNVSTLAAWRITLVPVKTGDGRVATIVSPTKTALNWVDFAKHVHPVPDTLDVAVGSTLNSSVTTMMSDGSNWTTVLTEVAAKHAAEDPHSNRYYYGVVSPNYSSGVVGLGYVGAPTAIGWDKDASGVTLAHEEGHNMGDNHSPCGGASNPDPNYPYPGGIIGVAGWDVYATTGNLKPTTDHDLMGYCNNNWISDYVYKNEFNYRFANDPITPAPFIAADATTQEGLLIWGHMENGKMILEPAFRIPVSSARQQFGAYQWEARDAAGQLLASMNFDAPEIADAPDGTAPRGFAFVVPMTAQALSSIHNLRVTKDGVELARTSQSAAPASAPQSVASNVRIQALANHSIQLDWDAKSSPVLMIRDALTGEVRGFARGGSAVLQDMPDNVEIHYSDGIRPGSVRLQRQLSE
jgi:hypothetical protein